MTPTHPESELVALLATLRDSILHSSVADGERPGLLDELGALEAAITRAATVPQGVLDDVMREALAEVIRATRAYLSPDGISPQDCISRVLAATDNTRINAALGEIE